MPDGPIQSFSERTGARPRRERLHQVPDHVDGSLRQWLWEFLTPQLEQQIARLMSVTLSRPSELGEALHAATGYRAAGGLVEQLRWPGELQEALDYALRLDEALLEQLHWRSRVPTTANRDGWPRIDQVSKLEEILDQGGSTLTVAVHDEQARLDYRADPTAGAALAQVADDGEPTASDLLRRAWAAAYARDASPNEAYLDAVRAVETQIAADGVISPNRPKPTLGTMTAELRDGARRFELTLLDRDGDGSVTPLVEMLDRLWRGNVCRHGGLVYRDQTVAEARAAVQLALVCVQWLSGGVLQRRSTSGTP